LEDIIRFSEIQVTYYGSIQTNLQSAKVGYSNGGQYSIYCDVNCGPAFGGGNDLICSNYSTWYSYDSSFYCSYPKIGAPQKFNTEDYEVFQVIKK